MKLQTVIRLAAGAAAALGVAACREDTAPPAAAQPQAAAALAPALPSTFPDPVAVSAGVSRVELAASGGRDVDVTIWTAPRERAVVVFSHGHGGRPAAYRRIVSAWTAAGFTVVAPLHVDSTAHPRRDEFDLQRGFIARIEDLALARAFIKARHPGKPLIAAGHSFGSLMSLIEAGALTAAGPQGDRDVRAVVALSSAGDIPGVIREQTYAGVTTPLLLVTGDRDLVDGWVTDWRAHRSAFDRSPAGDKLLAVFEGGTHTMVGDADAADFAFLARLTTTFMQAYGLGDAAARARLDTLEPPRGVSLERR